MQHACGVWPVGNPNVVDRAVQCTNTIARCVLFGARHLDGLQAHLGTVYMDRMVWSWTHIHRLWSALVENAVDQRSQHQAVLS